MSLSIGIVGLPNVGKSTLFNALLKRQVAFAANYPFATIEPNVGVVPVNDPRLDDLAQYVRNDYGNKLGDREVPEKIIPTTVKFYDIAGLVKGASQGEGLGNEFLGHIKEVDAIVHLVKAFKDDNVVEAGTGDPRQDIEIINTELTLADLQTVEKRIEKISSDAKRGDKESKYKFDLYTKIKETLEKGTFASQIEFSKEDLENLRDLPLLTLKPVMYVFNVSEENISGKNLPESLKNLLSEYDGICISAKIESELSSLTGEDLNEFMKEMNITSSSLDKVINRGYELLSLESYLTMGPKEVRAWTISRGTKAPQAAGKIHTDFEKGFISAEVINYETLKDVQSLKKAKEKGLVRLEGKGYVVKDGDVVEFRFNV